MPSKALEQFKDLKDRITALLKTDHSPPKTMWEFGAWMAKNLTQEDLNDLHIIELGADGAEANDWLVQSMMDSGKYQCDGEGFVWVKEDSK